MFGNTPLGLWRPSEPSRKRRSLALWTAAGVVLGIEVAAMAAAHADPNLVLPGGLPAQVKPTFSEPGLPRFRPAARRLWAVRVPASAAAGEADALAAVGAAMRTIR